MDPGTSGTDDSKGESGTDDSATSASPGASGERGWQRRLLPFMVWMVVGLTLFFFVASFAQLAYLHVNIQEAPEVDLIESLAVPNEASPAQARRFTVLAQLEASTLQHRYHQANVFLMSRVWARYLGFVTGMILALVGAAFILGRLREEATEVRAKGGGAALSLRSTSPGLVLAVLGVTLMITTIVTHHPITTADSAVYMRLAYDEKPPLGRDAVSLPDTTREPVKGPDADFP